MEWLSKHIIMIVCLLFFVGMFVATAINSGMGQISVFFYSFSFAGIVCWAAVAIKKTIRG